MPDKQLFTFRIPVGVAAIITAGNFPVAVPSWYLVPALLCGNAVVWKPAEYAPRSPTALAQLFHAGGVPERRAQPRARRRARRRSPGCEQALEQRLVDKVGFTGSTAVGARDRRAVRPPPAVAVPGARRQEPAGRHGRRRPRPRRRGRAVQRLRHRGPALHVARHRDRRTSDVHDEFVARLDERLRGAAIGDPTEDVLYGPMLARALRGALRGVARPDPSPPHASTARPPPGASRPTTRARASSATPRRASSSTRRSWTA